MKKYIKEVDLHYSEVARIYGASKKSTMHNDFIRDSETKFIIKCIDNFDKPNFSVLDIGCGNGYTLERLNKIYNKKPEIKADLNGIEPNKKLFQISKQRLSGQKVRLYNNGIFDFKSNKKYDIIVCQRVIINLLDENDQINAIKSIEKLLKKEGKLILIECFESSLNNLNNARLEFGLQKMKPSHHNLYLKRNYFSKLFKNKSIHFQKELQNSLSVHYYLARVIHPLLLLINKKDFQRSSPFLKFIRNLDIKLDVNFSPINLILFEKIK